MANPNGANQLQPFSKQWGDVKKATTLLKEAPISGAPRAATALAAAETDQDRGSRPRSPQKGTQSLTGPPVSLPAPTLASMWEQIATVPGISPLAHAFAQASVGR